MEVTQADCTGSEGRVVAYDAYAADRALTRGHTRVWRARTSRTCTAAVHWSRGGAGLDLAHERCERGSMVIGR